MEAWKPLPGELKSNANLRNSCAARCVHHHLRLRGSLYTCSVTCRWYASQDNLAYNSAWTATLACNSFSLLLLQSECANCTGQRGAQSVHNANS
eukprot:1874405-Amphidinium_carterae.1